MLIKDKDIASHQLLLIKQDRVLVNQLKVLASLISESGIFFFLFFYILFEKNGLVGRWETKHFIGIVCLEKNIIQKFFSKAIIRRKTSAFVIETIIFMT